VNPPSIAQAPRPACPPSLRSRWARLAATLGALVGDSLLALVARVALAAIFLQSGRTKVDGILHVTDGAVALFREEYRLPWIDPGLAAHLAAYAEHLFPLLLFVGLFTRSAALALLVMTAVIEIFVYPDAWPTHLTWAVPLMLLMREGGGRWSLDRLLKLSKIPRMPPATPAQVHHITHPLVQHKLTLMRNKEASSTSFRTLLGELAMLMAYEVTRDMPTHLVEIETPLEKMLSPMIDGKKLVFASILRAGNGMLDGLLRVVPNARVGTVGLYRDPKTLQAVEYYFKMPADMAERDVVVVDPMLATGHSAAAAIERIKACTPRSIKFLCLLAAPEGIATLQKAHPDVQIYTAAIDRQLNDHGYILPGLGDAGDRIFGTK
jgi:uracil phosphoribosyltransferase